MALDMELGAILSSQIEDVVDLFVTSAVGNVVTTAVPLVTIALTMSLMLQGLMMMVSPSGEPLSDLLKRFVGIAMISSFATAGGFYQSELASMIMGLPEEMSTALLVGTGISAENITDLVDNAIQAGLAIIVDLSADGNWRNWGPYFLAAMFATILIVVCGLTLAYILVAKVLLAVTVAFGPAFIFLLLFKSTKGLFSKWIGSAINYALLMVLLAAVLSFLMSFFEVVLADVRDEKLPYWDGILSSGILGVAAVVATLKLPGLASSWGGGIASSLLGFLPSSSSGKGSGPAPPPPKPDPTPDGPSPTGQIPGAQAIPGAGEGGKGGNTGGNAGNSASNLKYARR
ncbi:type IV secretion system protein [Halomonas sp. 3A7M]|uniref:type IV secretion system protein n=1 Tax=Halomonas sp. 3A7M TaxID=2742616 RepID=UPI001868EC5A|nr:type IV secretion system protein [Halomonas sp. 3A7M]